MYLELSTLWFLILKKSSLNLSRLSDDSELADCNIFSRRESLSRFPELSLFVVFKSHRLFERSLTYMNPEDILYLCSRQYPFKTSRRYTLKLMFLILKYTWKNRGAYAAISITITNTNSKTVNSRLSILKLLR